MVFSRAGGPVSYLPSADERRFIVVSDREGEEKQAMQIEAFLLADSASDYQGKLCLLGAFDTIGAKQLPITHRHAAVVLRLRFDQIEQGKHTVKLVLIDEDGKSLVDLDGEVNVGFPTERDSAAVNLLLNMNDLKFAAFGTYNFDLAIDGQLRARLPLYVVKIP